MIIRVVQPSGSIIVHPNMQGACEPPTGDLVLLHKDGTQRLYLKHDWSRCHCEREVIINKPIAPVETLMVKLENA